MNSEDYQRMEGDDEPRSSRHPKVAEWLYHSPNAKPYMAMPGDYGAPAYWGPYDFKYYATTAGIVVGLTAGPPAVVLGVAAGWSQLSWLAASPGGVWILSKSQQITDWLFRGAYLDSLDKLGKHPGVGSPRPLDYSYLAEPGGYVGAFVDHIHSGADDRHTSHQRDLRDRREWAALLRRAAQDPANARHAAHSRDAKSRVHGQWTDELRATMAALLSATDRDRQQAEGERYILLNLCLQHPSLFDKRDWDKVMGADRATLKRFVDFMTATGDSKRWNPRGRKSPEELATFLALFANSSLVPGRHLPPGLRRLEALESQRQRARRERLHRLHHRGRGLPTDSSAYSGSDRVRVKTSGAHPEGLDWHRGHGRNAKPKPKRKLPSPFDSRAQALAWARAHGYVLPPPGAGSTSYKAPAYSSGTTTSYNGSSSKSTKQTGKNESTYVVHEDHGGSHG